MLVRVREDCMLGYFGVWLVGLQGRFAESKALTTGRLYI